MSFNIIYLLQQQVTPIVLAEEKEDFLFKKQALTDFYPILLSAINAKPELFEKLRDQVQPDITEIFDNNLETTQQVLNYISGEASIEDVNSILNASLGSSLNLLVSEAGSSDIQVVRHLIKGQMPLVLNALPAWSDDLLTISGIKKTVEDVREELKKPEKLRATSSGKKKKPFPIQYVVVFILAVLLFMVVKSYLEQSDDDVENKNAAEVSEVVSVSSAQNTETEASSVINDSTSQVEIMDQQLPSSETIEKVK